MILQNLTGTRVVKLSYSLLLTLALTVTSAYGQRADDPIVIFSDTPDSYAQQVYLETLTKELRVAGFELWNDTELSVPIPRGDVREAVLLTDAALGVTLLQDHIGEGDSAAALLSTPGGFSRLAEQRLAQDGAIGDMARDQIADKDLLALRLWAYSATAFGSSTLLASVDDFAKIKTTALEPYSTTFNQALGSATVALAFAEINQSLRVGVVDATVVRQEDLSDEILSLFKGGTVVSEYQMRVGVTVTSERWWASLTSPRQQALTDALDLAEREAGDALQQQADQALENATDQGVQVLSWDSLANEKVKFAIDATISELVGGSGAPILEFRDDFIEFQREARPGGSPTKLPEQEGMLRTGTRVFFASDRRLDPNGGSLSSQFANIDDPNEVVRCGELVPSEKGPIGKVLDAPALIKGSRLHQNSECIDLITEALEEADGDLLVFVHGYMNSFDSAVRTGLAFARDAQLDDADAVLIWTWPSRAQLRSYERDIDGSLWSQTHLIDFIEKLQTNEDIAGISYLGHSMGTRILAALMGSQRNNRESAFVLAAADVSPKILRQAMKGVPAASITVLASEGDRALLASNGIHLLKRVGRAKPLFLAKGVDTIDLSAFDKFFAINHRHAFEAPEVLSDLKMLYGGEWNAKKRGLESKRRTGDSMDHFVITPK